MPPPVPAPVPDPESGAGAPAPAAPLTPAPSGLDYEVVRRVGRGGYGEVWLVRDKTGRYCACKVVYRESFEHDRPYEREYAGIQRFEPVSRASESQVNILHVGRRDAAGYFYYLMELADDVDSGQSIIPERYEPKTLRSEMLRRGRLPVSECLQLGLALSAALANLHQHGLIHRDVKPANIIFVHGLPKLADIGLVTEAHENVSYVGTEGYIPPEGPTSVQADVYALGKVLYELSTGRDRQDFPELPTDFGEQPDRQARLEFNAILTRACASDPRQRYASAAELHADLAVLQGGGSVRRRRAAKQQRRWAVRVALPLAALLLALGGGAYFQHHRAERMPSSPGASEPTPAKRPPPGAEELAASEATLRQSLKWELSETNPEAQLRVARELLTRSFTAATPGEQWADLQVAANLSAQAGDFASAMQACGRMETCFQTNALPLKIALLDQSRGKDLSLKASASLAEACIGTAFEALGEDDYQHGAALADIAQSAAERSKVSSLLKQAGFLKSQVAQCAEGYAGVKEFVLKLRQEPENPQANLRLGQFLCFIKNDWETGLPALARGNDPSLREVLGVELTHKPVRVPDLVHAGDLWWSVAETAPEALKLHYEQRAKYWYLQALALAKPPEKAQLKEQLAPRAQANSSRYGFLHITAAVNGTESIVIKANELHWLSTRGSLHNRVNHVQVGDLQAGAVAVIKNCGATRLIPEDVDFGTARLTVIHKSRRRAKVVVQRAEDHVRVSFPDQGGVLSEFDLTLSFGAGQ